MSKCGCGRSPNGNCVGWHKLTEEQYLEKKAAYDEKQTAKWIFLNEADKIKYFQPHIQPKTNISISYFLKKYSLISMDHFIKAMINLL